MKKVKTWMDSKLIALRLYMTQNNAGMGTVEIILIIVVLIGLVLIFKNQITDLVESIFSKITKQANKV